MNVLELFQNIFVLPSETNRNVHDCGMVDRRKAFSLISRRDHCQRISDMPQVRVELADNLPSSFSGSGFTVVIATTPRSHFLNQVGK